MYTIHTYNVYIQHMYTIHTYNVYIQHMYTIQTYNAYIQHMYAIHTYDAYIQHMYTIHTYNVYKTYNTRPTMQCIQDLHYIHAYNAYKTYNTHTQFNAGNIYNTCVYISIQTDRKCNNHNTKYCSFPNAFAKSIIENYPLQKQL